MSLFILITPYPWVAVQIPVLVFVPDFVGGQLNLHVKYRFATLQILTERFLISDCIDIIYVALQIFSLV